MKPNLRAPSRAATNVLCTLFVTVCLFSAIGCGDGGGDGAEDTGSIVVVSGAGTDTQIIDVDVAPDDMDGDGVITNADNLITSFLLRFSFENISGTPDQDTATRLRLDSCTVVYEPLDAISPVLDPADCLTLPVEIAPGATHETNIIVVPIERINDVNPGLGQDFDEILSYQTTITFGFENVPFDKSQTRTVRLSTRMFNVAGGFSGNGTASNNANP
ncbi:MAG: hypothetical protein PVF51_00620 [Nitrospirota bacterium]|jgi:hypothetical protein